MRKIYKYHITRVQDFVHSFWLTSPMAITFTNVSEDILLITFSLSFLLILVLLLKVNLITSFSTISFPYSSVLLFDAIFPIVPWYISFIFTYSFYQVMDNCFTYEKWHAFKKKITLEIKPYKLKTGDINLYSSWEYDKQKLQKVFI